MEERDGEGSDKRFGGNRQRYAKGIGGRGDRGEKEQRDRCLKRCGGGGVDGSGTKGNTSIVISSKGIHLQGVYESVWHFSAPHTKKNKPNTECIIFQKEICKY